MGEETRASFPGMLDIVRHDRIAGWAHDSGAPEQPVVLLVAVNGRLLERVQADLYRDDLQQAGFGDGRKSFDLPLSPPLSALKPQRIEVRREADGEHIPGSPQMLLPETEFVTPQPATVAAPEEQQQPAQAEEQEEEEEEEEEGKGEEAEEEQAEATGAALQGNLDLVRHDLLAGWAHAPASPDAPLELLVFVNQQLRARMIADRYREDLEHAGFGDGRRSFELALAPPLSTQQRQVIEIRREHDGLHLPGSPRELEAEVIIDAAEPADSTDQLTDSLLQLNQQMESLVQQRAELRRRQSLQHEPESDPPAVTRRALVIAQTLPHARSADASAILSQLRSLHRLGFEVSFAASEPSAEAAADLDSEFDYCGPPWYGSVEELLQVRAGHYDLVLLHRLAIADRYVALVRRHQPRARVVYSIGELQFLRLKRQAAVEQRPELITLSDRAQIAELLTISRVDQVITHSSREAAMLRLQTPNARVHVVPWSLAARPTAVAFEQRRGIALIGDYAQGPDLDAAYWLIGQVLPLLRARDPGFECLLVGEHLPDALKTPIPGIVAIGAVDRLADIFDRVRLTVAPMTYAAGIQGRVLESLAAGLPCVCTPIATEGLELPDGLLQQASAQPQQFAANVLRLHEDAEFNRSLGAEGLAYIENWAAEPQIDLLMRAACTLPAAGTPR